MNGRDYYETDGDHYDLYRLWGNRAAIHPTMPIIFLQGNDIQRAMINEEFERVGLCTVGSHFQHLRSLLPNTNSASAGNLPSAVRYYKCNGKVEDEEPCESRKWEVHDNSCNISKYQIKIRSGWKDHKLRGRAIGMFLIHMLTDALNELKDDPFTIDSIHDLTAIQDSDRSKFRGSSLYETHKGANLGKNTNFLGGHGMYSPFWRSNTFCRAALLPNQARYDGIIMGTRGTRHVDGYYTGYDMGYSIDALPNPDPSGDSTDVILAYLPESRQNCSSVVQIDYKDFFLVRQEDNWVKVVIPNDAEARQFKRVSDKRGAHAIVLCDRICESEKCDEDHVSVAEVRSQKLAIKVDDVNVTTVRSLSQEPSLCHLLIGEHDSFLWINGREQFKVELQLRAPGTLRLSSIIVI